MTEDERNERIAEAKMIIALSYAEMFRYVGGVCWIDHSIEPNETMEFPRLTFCRNGRQDCRPVERSNPLPEMETG